jgi:hypothetical protein
MKKTILLTLLSIYYLALTWGQTGSIQGTILDKKTADPLIGATIQLVDTDKGTATDIDGFFSMEKIPIGTYSIRISYISYEEQVIPGVSVQEGQVTSLKHHLAEASATLQEVVVVSEKVRTNEVAILSEIKSAMQVVSGISEQQIKRSLDGNAAQIVKRVPGITVVGDRFINIRGLNARYNNVLLHNAITPSMETDIKSFSFDIIPANQIERMLIYKSPSADLPGDFAGGVVKIFTRGIPEKSGMTIDYSAGFRQGTTFQNFLQPEVGDFYWTGFDNSYNSLPNRFPSSVNNIINNPLALELAGKSLRNNWVALPSTATPDQKISIQHHARIKLGDTRIGNVTSVSYGDSRSTFGIQRGDFNEQFNGQESVIYNYNDLQYNRNIRIGVLHNWTLKLPQGHQIEWKNLFNQNSIGSYVYRSGKNFESNYQPNSHSFDQVYKNIYTSQLTGSHSLGQDKTIIDWTVGYNRASRYQPDYRRYRSDFDPASNSSSLYVPVGAAQAFFLGRFSSDMLEKGYNGTLHLSHSFKAFTLKWGGFIEQKNREFAARNLGYVRSSTSDFDFQLINGTISNLFQNVNNRSGIKIDEQTNPSDSYTSTNDLYAGYATVTIPFTNQLALQGGARLEHNNQTLSSGLIGGEPIYLAYPITKLLPSATLNYNLSVKTLLKTSYGMTLNRPEFRELAPFAYYDFDYNYVYKGSPLQTAIVQNFDSRIEHYPSPNEVLSFAVFYKNFKDPIESLVEPGAGSGGAKTFTFGNAERSISYGVEVEVKKSLQPLSASPLIQRLSVVANATLIRSRVTLGDAISAGQSNNRPLQGQSPYIINGGISYNDLDRKWAINLLYNVIGKRIFAVGFDGYPDLYEMPRHVLDFTISKEWSNRLTLKAGISDILNARTLILQDGNQDGKWKASNDQIIQDFRPGSVAQIGLSYRIY